MILRNIDAEKIATVVDGLNKEKLEQMNENIIQKQKIIGIQEMCRKIKEQCYEA